VQEIRQKLRRLSKSPELERHCAGAVLHPLGYKILGDDSPPLDVIQAANARFPSLLPLLPHTLPALHIDTTATPPDDVFAQVRAFIGLDVPTP